MVMSTEGMERVLDAVEELAEADYAAFDQQFEGTPLGTSRATDDEFARFFEQQLGTSPPVPMITPTGEIIVASPWVVMLSLPNVANGREWLNRYARIVRKRSGGE